MLEPPALAKIDSVTPLGPPEAAARGYHPYDEPKEFQLPCIPTIVRKFFIVYTVS